MKTNIILIGLLIVASSSFAQHVKVIKLNAPNLERKGSLMEALSLRKSERKTNPATIELQDLSDLLWAANGINRTENGRRTAPSAINGQDIDIYVFNKTGVYLYDAKANSLQMVKNSDNRELLKQRKNENPAMICLMVSDISRFRGGSNQDKIEWAAMDAGIVTQNILLFCASNNLICWPRSGMNRQKIKDILNLTETQYPLLNVPVSYNKNK